MIRITKLDITRFTEGDCHILARAIHRLKGWPMRAFEYEDGPSLHVWVERPDGLYLDITGLKTPKDMLDEWVYDMSDPLPTRQFAEKDFTEWQWSPDYGRYSLRRARQLAPYLASLDSVSQIL